jgi:hypothetical protein
MSLEKPLFQICESFHLRKIVGWLSVDCITWMYSYYIRFSSPKKSLKLIKSSNSCFSRSVNKDFDFPMRTLSYKLIGSMILVVLIGGTRKLYLQCEFFHFYNLLYGNVYELWKVVDPNGPCCMLYICLETAQFVSFFHFHRLVHPRSITVCGHVSKENLPADR